jgi:homoserine dehydrogenase
MMNLTTKRIILCGMGTVGKAFARLLDERREQITRKYGLDIEMAAAVDVGGAAVADQGALPLGDLLVHVDAGGTVETFASHGRPGLSGVAAISRIPAEVMVETTPTNLVDGEPARGHIFAALNNGLDVVSANKGPLVLFHREILNLAKEKGCRIFMSAATAAALPTLDVGLICLAGANVLAIEGVLNGTTNYILTRMHLEKCSYETALKAAQEMGIAETDPTLDVEGLDTRNKIVVIANRIFDKHFTIDDVAVEGITRVSPADIDRAMEAGRVIKLVGTAERNGGGVTVSVGPKILEAAHPLAAVNYAEKSISYLTDTMGRVTVTGGKSSPTGAAAALLKDLIHTVMLAA